MRQRGKEWEWCWLVDGYGSISSVDVQVVLYLVFPMIRNVSTVSIFSAWLVGNVAKSWSSSVQPIQRGELIKYWKTPNHLISRVIRNLLVFREWKSPMAEPGDPQFVPVPPDASTIPGTRDAYHANKGSACFVLKLYTQHYFHFM